jgi:fructose-bisphosphate aldolase class I
MDKALLSKTAAAMVAKGRGVLAADESSATCETRFKTIQTECTEENRRAYRGLLFTTPDEAAIQSFITHHIRSVR